METVGAIVMGNNSNTSKANGVGSGEGGEVVQQYEVQVLGAVLYAVVEAWPCFLCGEHCVLAVR